jgi:phage terminase large subunit-like protein
LKSSSASDEAAWVARLSSEQCSELYFDWPLWARAEQLPPPGDWVTWLLLGGRGAGKTRAGAEWCAASRLRGSDRSRW